MSQPSEPMDPRDRRYVSQYATDVLGLIVLSSGVAADADGEVSAALLREADNALIFTRVATHEALGTYSIQLARQDTTMTGNYSFLWTYSLDGLPQEYRTYIQVGQAAPAYDGLTPGMKDIVDDVWVRLADLFDSQAGGPNLQTYFQSHFGRGRIAQLLRFAVGRLNTAAQPFQTYTLDGDGGASFPVDQWGALLSQALWVETIKHLRRSYLEQPAEILANPVSRLDRRDYFDRWGQILKEEEALLSSELTVFKIRNMGLGRPRVLVSGGVWGRFAPTRTAAMAGRPRYWSALM